MSDNEKRAFVALMIAVEQTLQALRSHASEGMATGTSFSISRAARNLDLANREWNGEVPP